MGEILRWSFCLENKTISHVHERQEDFSLNHNFVSDSHVYFSISHFYASLKGLNAHFCFLFLDSWFLIHKKKHSGGCYVNRAAMWVLPWKECFSVQSLDSNLFSVKYSHSVQSLCLFIPPYSPPFCCSDVFGTLWFVVVLVLSAEIRSNTAFISSCSVLYYKSTFRWSPLNFHLKKLILFIWT